ncbi:MAG: NifU family protein [Chitinophagales bacterium]|jgi:Fe-S cluster biogenesis protein NfuA|nr:NifU family protein [Sphingobacteriales bacterium]
MQTPIEIYFEQTPNPESLKLVTNQILLPNIIIDRRHGEDTSEFPLADSLFEKFEWLSGVFVSNNFVTLTKSIPNDWYEYMSEARDYIKMYIENNFDIVTKSYLDTQLAEKMSEKEDTVEGKIKDLLEKYVKPAVEKDGGFIAFHSFENGLVKLKMQGSCSGCPSSQITLKSGIEGLLKRMVPEVMEVEAEAG